MKRISLYLILFLCSAAMVAKTKEPKVKPDISETSDSIIKSEKTTPYTKITAGAKSSKGMFTVYKKAGSYYFEIPDSLLGRDMLVAARVVNISDNNKISAGQRRNNPILISFSRRDKLLFMHQPTGNSLAKATDPISVSLANNNVVPVVMTFEIAARNASNDASVVDVTKLFSSEFDLVFPAGIGGTGKLDTKASQIVEMKSFPKNVEVKSFYNYNGGREPFAVTINYSFVLLSKIPIRPRLSDERMSYSAENKRFYESGKPCSSIKFIDRWHIEPLAEDVEKHKNGELVVPQQQILFYVDTVMPEKWRGFVKQGIETWNAAFEKIGFKNVIKAIDFPRNKNFDPDDIRNNCFRYVTSTDANAQGPQWIDPRTSEIIQGDILWWHNVIDLLQTWRFVQTAAADPEARKKVLSDEIMGDAIRYAVAHEMGHVLGLQHNMRGSYAYPTDSLRSATFTQKYGTTASIMDYARNNYVAQPGDKEKGVRLTPPVLGPYDYFSIAWGYNPIYEAKTSDEEVATLNKWLIEKGNNPMYYNGATTVSPVVPDPAAQSDALGNDLVKSANYGISNLKFITKNLVKWTMEEGDGFDLLNKRFDAITKLHFRLSNLPLSYLGGAYTMYGTYGQHDAQIIPIEKQKQKEAIRFIINGLVDYQWLNQPEINKQLGSATEEIMKWQSSVMGHLFGNFILARIVNNEALYTQNPYFLEEYFKDVDNQIWVATTKNQLTGYEQNIQLTYIDRLCALIRPLLTPNDKQDGRYVNETTWASAAASQLAQTRVKVAQLMLAQPQHTGHYKLILNMIDKTTK
jgi:hypothetical protein